MEGWWNNLGPPEEEVIQLYEGYCLCEQFHSEFKSDSDMERLSSGKFAANRLIISLVAFAYNILHSPFQTADLLERQSPIRHPGKRRRVKNGHPGIDLCRLLTDTQGAPTNPLLWKALHDVQRV